MKMGACGVAEAAMTMGVRRGGGAAMTMGGCGVMQARR